MIHITQTKQVVQSEFGLDTVEKQEKRYHELMQDNKRMRDVIESLEKELETYKQYSNTTTIQQELMVKTVELESAQAELLELRSKFGQPSEEIRIEINQYKSQIEEWESRYSELEIRYKKLQSEGSDEQNKQLKFLQSKLRLFEIEQEKSRNTSSQYQNLQQSTQNLNFQIQDLSIQNEEYLNEINELQSRCEQYEVQINNLQLTLQRIEGKTEIDRLNAVIEGLLHEIETWKQRYQALESKFNNRSEYSKFQTQLTELTAKVQQYESLINQQRNQIGQLNMQFRAQSSQEVQGIRDQYESQLQELQMQLNEYQSRQSEYDRELEGHRLRMEVYGENQFFELQTNYENRIREMEADIQILIDEVQHHKELHQRISLSGQSDTEKLRLLETQLEQERTKMKEYMVKSKFSERAEGQINDLKHQIQIWKNRYLQTELRLKEFDELQIEYSKLQAQLQQYKIQIEEYSMNTQMKNTTQIQEDQMNSFKRDYERQQDQLKMQISSIQQESERYKQQLYQLEQRNRDLQMELDKVQREKYQGESNVKGQFQMEISKLQNELREKDQFIQKLQYQISQMEQEIKIKSQNDGREKDALIKKLQYQISQMESDIKIKFQSEGREKDALIQKLQYQISQMESDIKIKFQSEGREKDALIQKLQYQLSQMEQEIKNKESLIINLRRQCEQQEGQGKQGLVVIQEEIKLREKKIVELESIINSIRLQLERCTVVRKEQETKIQLMITQITEYESQLNILKEENKQLTIRKANSQNYIVQETKYSTQQYPKQEIREKVISGMEGGSYKQEIRERVISGREGGSYNISQGKEYNISSYDIKNKLVGENQYKSGGVSVIQQGYKEKDREQFESKQMKGEGNMETRYRITGYQPQSEYVQRENYQTFGDSKNKIFEEVKSEKMPSRYVVQVHSPDEKVQKSETITYKIENNKFN